MKKVTFIILFDVSKTDRVEHAEAIENSSFEIKIESGCETGASFKVKDLVLNELDISNANSVVVIPISDFMNEANNQEINLENFWISYVSAIINKDTQ